MTQDSPESTHKIQQCDVSFSLYFSSTHSISRKQGTGKAKGCKSIGGDVSRPRDSRRAPVVKTEPVDDDEALSSWASSSKSGMKAKETQSTHLSGPIVISSEESDPPTSRAKPAKSTHLSGPIVISSEESDPPTPRAKPAKSNNSKPKASYVLSLLSVPLFSLISEVRSIPAVRDSGKTSSKLSRF